MAGGKKNMCCYGSGRVRERVQEFCSRRKCFCGSGRLREVEEAVVSRSSGEILRFENARVPKFCESRIHLIGLLVSLGMFSSDDRAQ